MPITDVQQSLANLKLEQDAIVLYDALARIERDPQRAAAFRQIAQNERRHSQVWADKLREQGVAVPEPGGPRLRVRLIIWTARLFGTHAVSELVQALEGDEEEAYAGQPSPEVEAIVADERQHAEIWKTLARKAGAPGAEEVTRGAAPPRTAALPLPGIRPGAPSDERAATARDGRARHERPGEIIAGERWHRRGQSGTLRAAIFGISDGLGSNLALTMGVAGAGQDPRVVLLAGVAGLLAGSFSMAAGEWISMRSQRELFERQIELERAELAAIPEEEEAELALIYGSKGFTEEESKAIAHRMVADPESALDTLVREELGLDPTQLGSPWGAALGSLATFALGAAIPLVPYVFLRGGLAFPLSLGISIAALFLVGAAVSLLTGKSAIFSGLRQALIGTGAAAITYAVGYLIGVSVA